MTEVVYQSQHHFIVGRGPHTCGVIGCVLCSCVMALRDLGIDSSISPEILNMTALEDGAFDSTPSHEALDVPRALARYPVHVEGKSTTCLAEVRDRIFALKGRALVRVAFTDESIGDHTILGTSVEKDGSMICLDPAIGHVRLNPSLKAAHLPWGHDKDGKQIFKDYRVVNLRGIYAQPTT